ncbi:Polyketide synthase PksJ (PKS) [Durusdinium trenchii]|uniref:Polyketide synthase PksJ (PKS) n=1 Tax=Durusdinium trenchii TaxID=1381693 RepID=A0ABP0R906_9DINO
MRYTSGSTGTPKGVLVPRRGVLNVLHSFDAMVRGSSERGARKILATTTYCFDISVLEIFWPLCFGFSLFLVSANTARNGPRLARLLESQGADLLQGTPALWRSLVAAGWQGHPGLSAICGGEAFPVSLVKPLQMAAGAGVWNAYGPTEATIWATTYAFESSFDASVPIGLPLPNVRLCMEQVEEARVEESADGSGELLVGGIGVALGYHCRPELTAKSFVQRSGGCVYRTGDLVCLGEGGFQFLGRIDQQVKFRGFRIELGEIESVLERHPAVLAAIAALSSMPAPTLLAFVQCNMDIEVPKPSVFRSHLAAALPASS